MNYRILIISFLFFLASCNSVEPEVPFSKYRISVSNIYGRAFIMIENGERVYSNGNQQLQVDISVTEMENKSIFISYEDTINQKIGIEILKDGEKLVDYTGFGFLSVDIYYKGTKQTSSGITQSGGSTGGGSGGNNSDKVCPCGAPTKDKTPCKRSVKGCTYCWQHD